jgi:hypothetical protein
VSHTQVGGMKAKAGGMKAVKAVKAMKTDPQDTSRPAMLVMVVCLSGTLVTVWLASGCGLAPCGAHGVCEGIFMASCACTDGFLGDACQYGAQYEVEGCHVQRHCGTFNQTSYRCDRAPVYQLGGDDGPVLYRHTTRDTNWAIGPSSRKVDCAAIPALSSFTQGVTEHVVYVRSYFDGVLLEEPPSSLHFDGSFGGWRDFEAPHGSQLGAVQVRDV